MKEELRCHSAVVQVVIVAALFYNQVKIGSWPRPCNCPCPDRPVMAVNAQTAFLATGPIVRLANKKVLPFTSLLKVPQTGEGDTFRESLHMEVVYRHVHWVTAVPLTAFVHLTIHEAYLSLLPQSLNKDKMGNLCQI